MPQYHAYCNFDFHGLTLLSYERALCSGDAARGRHPYLLPLSPDSLVVPSITNFFSKIRVYPNILSRYGCVVVVNMKIRESREVVCCVRRIKRARNDTCIYGVTATPTLQFTSSFYLLICQFLCSYFLLPAL